VLAIARGEAGVIVPVAGEVLRAGDVLALAGTHDAVAAASELLRRPRGPQHAVTDEPAAGS
jgi:CPA2 family monovalent cation:H+ antiporter-2